MTKFETLLERSKHDHLQSDVAIIRHIVPNMYISEMNLAEMAVCGEHT